MSVILTQASQSLLSYGTKARTFCIPRTSYYTIQSFGIFEAIGFMLCKHCLWTWYQDTLGSQTTSMAPLERLICAWMRYVDLFVLRGCCFVVKGNNARILSKMGTIFVQRGELKARDFLCQKGSALGIQLEILLSSSRVTRLEKMYTRYATRREHE
jgi:hypothetical protein